MFKTPFLILVIVLVTLVTVESWETENYNDFIHAVSELHVSICQGETYNYSNFTFVEAQEQEPDPELLVKYMNRDYSRCEFFYRGVYHWMALNDPSPENCGHFYTIIHDWVVKELWNWKFQDCGLNYGKDDWIDLVVSYLIDFPAKTLDVQAPSTIVSNTTQNDTWWAGYNYTYDDYDYNDSDGGGGINMQFLENLDFDKSILLGGYYLIGLLVVFLLYSYMFSRKLWKGELWAMSFSKDDPIKNEMASVSKKLKYMVGVFIVVNLVFWLSWVIGGPVFYIVGLLLLLSFLWFLLPLYLVIIIGVISFLGLLLL